MEAVDVSDRATDTNEECEMAEAEDDMDAQTDEGTYAG